MNDSDWHREMNARLRAQGWEGSLDGDDPALMAEQIEVEDRPLVLEMGRQLADDLAGRYPNDPHLGAMLIRVAADLRGLVALARADDRFAIFDGVAALAVLGAAGADLHQRNEDR